MRLRILALVVALVGLVPSGAAAAPSQTDIEKQLRCVTCGTPLNVSNAPSAIQMKERIDREIAAGLSEKQIIDGFVRDYGRTVLSNPPKSGIDLWLAWAIPIGLPILALLALPFIIRGWRRRSKATDAGLDIGAADEALVDRELEAFGDG